MPSFKAKMFNLMIRKQHLFRGKLKKEVFDFNTSIQHFRDRCEQGADKYATVPEDVTVKPELIDGINSEWLIPKDAKPEKLIMYVHGGGYVSGSCNDHRGFVAKFSKYTGITNLTYEYGLAPEKPFPAAIEDSAKIYKWLLQSGYKPENIIIAGESAGGGLCLAILLYLKQYGMPYPVAAIAISPWTDLTCSSDSYRTKNKLSPAPINSWFVFGKHYYGENDPSAPLISPLFGDLKGLPPLFINSGTDDELYEDGEKFYLKAKESGVEVTFREGEGMIHCYPLLTPMFKEATEAMDEIVAFVKKHL